MKYAIVGCNLMFGATEETFKSCVNCELTPHNTECIDNIAVLERHWIFKKLCKRR